MDSLNILDEHIQVRLELGQLGLQTLLVLAQILKVLLKHLQLIWVRLDRLLTITRATGAMTRGT